MLQLRCEGLVQCRVIFTPEICVLLCSICGGSGGPKINASYGLVIRDTNIKRKKKKFVDGKTVKKNKTNKITTKNGNKHKFKKRRRRRRKKKKKKKETKRRRKYKSEEIDRIEG